MRDRIPLTGAAIALVSAIALVPAAMLTQV
jgi:hypothetical protein